MRTEILACNLCAGNCSACFYAEQCNAYNDVAPYDRATVTVKATEASMALCQGRHNIPEAVDGAVFETEVNPLDVEALEDEATRKLSGLKSLNLYVTGLTVALVAVLNACRQLGVKVVLYHFDRSTDSYYRQEVK